jgi:hypothetical protein
MGEVSKPINKEVKPGELFEITVEFVAPKQPGNYCAFYRFAYGKSKKFGQKVWCDIIVNEPEDEIARL